MKIIQLLVIIPILLLASCSKIGSDLELNASKDSEQISFEIAVNKATATASNVGTRVSTSSTYQTTFEKGDEIGVYIVKGDGGLQSSGNWVDNMKLRYSDGKFIPEFPSGKEYYPTGGEPLNFYAYYPYQESITDATNLEFSAKADQRNRYNLSKSDFLTASTLNQVNANGPVKLSFRHLFTLVELSVMDGGIGAQMSNKIAVQLEGCSSGVNLNLATGTIVNTGNPTAVKMYRVEQQHEQDYLNSYTYRAIIPAQTVDTNEELFSFKQGSLNSSILKHKVTSPVTLHENEVKPYAITLQNNLSSDHSYNVGDYYPYKGFPIGVVLETSNDGKNGKIFSLIQNYSRQWGELDVDETASGVANIRDEDDGQAGTKNLILKRKDQANFSTDYGLFNLIYSEINRGNIDGMWYLPAFNEVKKIVAYWFNDMSAVNIQIETAGGDVFDSSPNFHYYMSMTEVGPEISTNMAYVVSMDFTEEINKIIYRTPADKDLYAYNMYVRTMAKF